MTEARRERGACSPLRIEVVCHRNLAEAVECSEAFHPTLPHFLALVHLPFGPASVAHLLAAFLVAEIARQGQISL